MSAGWTQQMAMTQRTFFVTPLLNKMQSWLALLKMLNQNVASQMSETHSPVNFPCECNLPMCDSALNEPAFISLSLNPVFKILDDSTGKQQSQLAVVQFLMGPV